MPGALVALACLLAAGCASAPAPRPLASGFAAAGGVADPYADGKRHLDAGNHQLAAQRFGQALTDGRRSLDALNGLGVAYTRLGRFESAHSQFERALQIEPRSALTLNNYGWSLLEQGRLREGRAFLELARRHATDAEAPVIAANLENLARARPPALLAALDEDGGPEQPRGPHRLVRVDDHAWQLETTANAVEPLLPPGSAHDAPPAPAALGQEAAAIGPEEQPAPPEARPAPSIATRDPGAIDAAPAAAEPSPHAESQPDAAARPPRGGPIQLWRRPAPDADTAAEAGPNPAGDEE